MSDLWLVCRAGFLVVVQSGFHVLVLHGIAGIGGQPPLRAMPADTVPVTVIPGFAAGGCGALSTPQADIIKLARRVNPVDAKGRNRKGRGVINLAFFWLSHASSG